MNPDHAAQLAPCSRCGALGEHDESVCIQILQARLTMAEYELRGLRERVRR